MTLCKWPAWRVASLGTGPRKAGCWDFHLGQGCCGLSCRQTSWKDTDSAQGMDGWAEGHSVLKVEVTEHWSLSLFPGLQPSTLPPSALSILFLCHRVPHPPGPTWLYVFLSSVAWAGWLHLCVLVSGNQERYLAGSQVSHVPALHDCWLHV